MAISKARKNPGVGPNTQPSSVSRTQRMLDAGWKAAGGSKVVGWEEGREIVGVLLAIRDGKFGPLADIRLSSDLTVNGEVHTAGEVIALGAPTILHSRLRTVPVGDAVYIACKGTIETEKGQSAWDFDVLSRKVDADQEEFNF